MKTILIALVLLAATAQASVRNNALALNMNARNNAPNNAQLAGGLVNSIARAVTDRRAVLAGTTNTTSLGSLKFFLPISNNGRLATELRATLVQNDPTAVLPYGVSTNPDAFHLKVDLVVRSSNMNNNAGNSAAIRDTTSLMFTGRPEYHTGGTRTLIYQSEMRNTPVGKGRLVAYVNQVAVPTEGIYKTTLTYIRIER